MLIWKGGICWEARVNIFNHFLGFVSWNTSARFYILFGAIAFIASDSFLAINKFQEPIDHAAILIMSTYLAAQFGIVYGVIKFNTQKM